MRASKHFLIALFLTLFLTACQFDLSPIISGTVERYENGRSVNAAMLSPAQVRDLTAWFSQRKSGWSSSVASYAPSNVVRIKHSDGDTTVINVFSKAVVVYNNKGQFMQEFRADDLSNLRAIVERKDG